MSVSASIRGEALFKGGKGGIEAHAITKKNNKIRLKGADIRVTMAMKEVSRVRKHTSRLCRAGGTSSVSTCRDKAGKFGTGDVPDMRERKNTKRGKG